MSPVRHAYALVAARITTVGADDELRQGTGSVVHTRAGGSHEEVGMADPTLSIRLGKIIPHAGLLIKDLECLRRHGRGHAVSRCCTHLAYTPSPSSS